MGRRGHLGCASAALFALLALGACPQPQVVPSPGWARYRVVAGDTLSGIAARYRVSLDELIRINRLAYPDRLAVGQELIMPLGAGQGAAAPAPQAGLLAWPVKAIVSSLFGPRGGRPHEGIDLAVPDGTQVCAAADGRVIYAGNRISGYGNLVILRHGDRLTTVYAHNSRLQVSEGALVSRGQVIAISGHSGRVTAPHLHFEVRWDGVPYDPLAYLPR